MYRLTPRGAQVRSRVLPVKGFTRHLIMNDGWALVDKAYLCIDIGYQSRLAEPVDKSYIKSPTSF